MSSPEDQPVSTPSATATAAPSPRAASRVRASELSGRTWLNTGGTPLDLAALRGKIVILDFC
ncbi:hypothetical protein E7744_02740 [Citricoccus sp. SGAir0253]|uniref:hypothetical protein n=1 Tax=Citricoccus sp. SGAir0253 TaxID=2567881 RepID=UPI0010CD4AA2|nr:hypothetical protein E7744_02740 [Citricoccus sp. SGAir0253]